MPTEKQRTRQPLRVLITGASTGIGKALALRLGRRGHKIALVARRTELLEKLVAEIEAAGGEAHAIAADLTHFEAPANVVEEARKALGGLDVLVNNAGTANNKPVARQKPERIEEMLDLNIRAPFLLCRHAIPHLKKSRHARIINVASIVGHAPFPGMAVYSATKHALIAFSDALRAELSPAGIAVCTVSPGLVDTPLAENFPAPYKGIAPEKVAAAIERLIARPRANVFVPRSVEAAALVRRLAPTAFRRGLSVYQRMQGRGR